MTERKPRWWLRILSVVVVLGVLVCGAEFALRMIIPGVIENVVRGQLKLTSDHPVEVDLGGSALLSAVQGGVGDVTINIDKVPLLDGVETDATFQAAKVPFNPLSGKITNGTVELVVPKDQLGSVVKMLTSGVAQTGEVQNGSLVVGRSIELFGQEVGLTAKLGLKVNDGAVEIDPQGVNAAGFDLTAEQLADATGTLLDPILQPQTVCVRDQLPAGVTLTDITLSSTGSARIKADLNPGIFSDSKQQQPGSCG
ncbi:DUF2993 domain-containing protein [Leucobacter coleopterorum]|uniref:DUF2993 domain-containing protein n=1 Tax=Leucobacter coleopterorum TaxID=2714933 RepID=A0ABX6K1Q9_9MICO|nr:DUF2993 domain-containing protein [Leucobacter coleopterorum]QIM19035.1 DUF2993 domain-containing protein [Leucobacter coleopterorum]